MSIKKTVSKKSKFKNKQWIDVAISSTAPEPIIVPVCTSSGQSLLGRRIILNGQNSGFKLPRDYLLVFNIHLENENQIKAKLHSTSLDMTSISGSLKKFKTNSGFILNVTHSDCIIRYNLKILLSKTLSSLQRKKTREVLLNWTNELTSLTYTSFINSLMNQLKTPLKRLNQISDNYLKIIVFRSSIIN